MRQVRIFALFMTVVLLLPLVVKNPYYLNVLAFVGLYTLVAVGLTLFIGYAGQISLGHGAFYASGAYVSAILSTRFGLAPGCPCP